MQEFFKYLPASYFSNVLLTKESHIVEPRVSARRDSLGRYEQIGAITTTI